jgi:dihydrolipoamide dehydrogenase
MFDLAVLGGGTGGYVAAISAAQRGLNVLLIEKDRLGGTCLNRGCIPTKSFLCDVKSLDSAQRSRVIEGSKGLRINVAKMVERKNQVVDSLVNGLHKIIQSHAIRLENGHGEMLNPQSIRVVGHQRKAEEFRARHVIIATGSRPAVPPFIAVDGQRVITSDEALDPDGVPQRVVIIGGGVIGLEFATIYLALGSEVTVLEMLPDIVMGEDEEVRRGLRRAFQKRGLEIHLEVVVSEIHAQPRGAVVIFKDKGGEIHRLEADKVLVATGRKPNLDGVEPERNGLRRNGPFIRVNTRMETGVHGVYAVGDLVGGLMLAHAASAEAEVAVDNLLGGKRELKPERIPRCIWTFPEVASVGVTEQQAKESGRSIKVGKFPYQASGKALAMGEVDGFVKIVGDSLTGEVLGVHIIGAGATDLISEAVLAMDMEGAVEDIGHSVKAHPSLSECVREAALDWDNQAVHLLKKRH